LILFKYYKQLGDQALAQLPDETAFFWSPGEESNSIAIIIQHLNGNMLSRWTEFLTTDGEKDFRKRDKEFELHIEEVSQLMELWEEGWSCLFNALQSVGVEDMTRLIYIRSKGHTIDEAVQRQLAHYAYHIGQIVYLARMQSGSNWSSLSIPKGKSKAFNQKARKTGKRKEHFTSTFLKSENPDIK